MGVPEHAHSPMHVWPSRFPETCQQLSKTLLDMAFPSLFFQAFSLIHCLSELLSPLSESTKSFAYTYFNKHHQCSRSSTAQALSQVRSLYLSHQTVQIMTVLWEWSLFFFLSYLECGLLLSRLLLSWGTGVGEWSAGGGGSEGVRLC